MTDLALHVDATTFQKGRHNITGGIWFTVGSKPFPAKGWNDFPAVVLGWWLEALRLRHLKKKACDLTFMDGPFSLKISTLDSANVAAEPYRNLSALTGLAVSVPVMTLDTQVLKSAVLVDETCRANDWESADIAFLRKQIFGLRQMIER